MFVNVQDRNSKINTNNFLPFYKSLKIRTRILGLFLIIITLSILVVAGSTNYIGKNSLQKMTKNQLNNSVRFVIDQISMLSGAYTSREFSGKLSYLLTSEQRSFDTAGLKAQIFIVDTEGNEIDQSNTSLKTNKKSPLPPSIIEDALKSTKGSTDLVINGEPTLVSYGYIIEKDWVYAVAVPQSSYLKPVYNLQFFTILSGIIAILLAFVFSFLGTRGIVDSIKSINATLSLADAGNLTVRANARNGGPEIISLSSNFNTMLSNFENLLKELGSMIEILTKESESLTAIAKESDESTLYIHNLTQKMADSSLEQEGFIAHIKESTDNITSLIHDILTRIESTSKASSIMMSTVYEGLNAIKELGNKIAYIEQVSDETVNHIKVLEARSDEINKITNTTKEISDQTKLLSFNASIEAARAGEFGAGFTVVAQEISKLAQSSAKSAFEVGEILKEINKDTSSVLHIANRGRSISHEGSEIAQKTDAAFNMILSKVTETHDQVNDISSFASNISSSVQSFAENINRISHIITDTSKTSLEIASTVESHQNLSSGISTSAQDLAVMANDLKKLKDEYVTQ